MPQRNGIKTGWASENRSSQSLYKFSQQKTPNVKPKPGVEFGFRVLPALGSKGKVELHIQKRGVPEFVEVLGGDDPKNFVLLGQTSSGTSIEISSRDGQYHIVVYIQTTRLETTVPLTKLVPFLG